MAQGTSLSLASKVLHRKRTWLIPIIAPDVIDRYRPLTGQRRATEAWSPLLECLANAGAVRKRAPPASSDPPALAA